MLLVNIAPKLLPEQYERNFADIAPRFTHNQAVIEASRCLYCFDAPCINACPTRINVPSFIKKIVTGNLKGSARVILTANILGESCGRVCPTEVLCEGACVLNGSGERPIEIGRLQRYAVDHILDASIRLFEAGVPNGHRVACIGSGPASLACAAELAKWGYDVAIYDRNTMPGGLNTYGIAAYKTRAADSLREVRLVEELGVKINQGVEIGKNIALEELEQTYDAIFIGIGLGETWDLDLPGEHLPGVFGAMDFIERTKTEPFEKIEVGRRVAVIGAGNTAIDCATAARRLGAECVYLMYRRGENEMPAFRYEYNLAKQDGVVFLWYTQPVEIVGDATRMGAGLANAQPPPPNATTGDAVHGLHCLRTQVEGTGRCARVELIKDSGFVLQVDMVIKALGQQPVTNCLKSVAGLQFSGGRIVVDPKTHQTGNPRYFAGGDCVNGGKEVVDAVAEGMAAARGIQEWLSARAVCCSADL